MYCIAATDSIGLLIILYFLVGICTICRINIYRHMDFEFTLEEKLWIFIYAPLYVFSAFPEWVRLSLRHEKGFIHKAIQILSFFYRMSEFSDKYVYITIKRIQAAEELAIQAAKDLEH